MTISIELFRPYFNQEETEAIKEVIDSKWWGMGHKTEDFEQKFAEMTGVKYAVGVNSGTSALQLAINVLQLPRDYTYIVPSISFIATAFAPIYEGYKIAFADIEEDSLLISRRTVEKTIADWNLDQAKVIVIPVHLYGNMNPELIDCSKTDSYVGIEDCAHACGSSWNDRRAGSIGVMGCFSFHAVKNLACGDAGMITTNSALFYKELKERRWFGINKSTFDRSSEDSLKVNYGWEYGINDLGYKMHMNDLQAALGLIQLARLEEGNQRRREIAENYSREFAEESWLRLPKMAEGVITSQHIYAIRTEHRDKLNLYLKDKGIATGVHYKPMYKFGYFGTFGERFAELCPTTEKEWVKLLSLPCYPSLTELEQEYIIAKVKEFGRKL